MSKVRTWAGLDVHAAKVVACVVDAQSGETTVRRLPGTTNELIAFCAELPKPVRVAYEAGPTGFGLARALTAAGIGCVIAAPGKIERPAADRVKTDQRDAERLVRLLMIDALHAVRVPGNEEQAIRDLVRAREDLRGDLMRARHRLSKLLLRHDVRYEDTTSAWNDRHRAWLAKVDLGERGAQATLLDYVGAIDALVVRRDTLEATIGELIPGSPLAGTVARLRCLRGLDTLSAVGLAAEIGDFGRFEKPAAKARSRRPVPGTHADCWSKPRGTTAGRHGSGPSSSAVKTASRRSRSRSPGKPSNACTRSGVASTPSAGSAARSSRSPSPDTSPASAGRSSTHPNNSDSIHPSTSAEEAAEPAWPPRARALTVLL
jgi:transposase